MKAEVSTVGIIGGGQLGMFLAQACQKIGLITHIYSDTDDAPAKKYACLLYTSPSPRDNTLSRMPSSA